jgi:endonuclease VIII
VPEGDTIFRLARQLDTALQGRLVTWFESPLPQLLRADRGAPIAGRTILGVRSIGKHLLIEFTGDLVLRTHLRMDGRWHLYRGGERWRRSRARMRIVLRTDAWEAVAFDVPVAQFIPARLLARHRDLGLGPDLAAADFDEEQAFLRMRAAGPRDIAGALLDQSIMAGIGNVFKSEVLFACGIDPSRHVAALEDAEVRAVVRKARKLLKANAGGAAGLPSPVARAGRRTTSFLDPASRLWVYRRAGRRCLRCGTEIVHGRHGVPPRSTYWCPGCQR